MQDNKFQFASTSRIDQREDQLAEFLSVAFLPEDRPLFVSDEASYYDVDAGDDEGVIERCAEHYNVVLTPADLSKPIWQLLDYLASKRHAI